MSSSIKAHNNFFLIFIFTFFFLYNEYQKTFTETQPLYIRSLKQKIYQNTAFVSVDIPSELSNHSRIRPVHRSIANLNYVSLIEALNYR